MEMNSIKKLIRSLLLEASSLFLLINLINLWPGYSVLYANAQLPNGGCDVNTQASLTINKNFPSNPAESFPITITNNGNIIARSEKRCEGKERTYRCLT